MLTHIALYRSLFKESLIYVEVSQNERKRTFSSTEYLLKTWYEELDKRTRWHKIPLCILISFYPQLCQCWLKCNHEKWSHILARLEATHWVQSTYQGWPESQDHWGFTLPAVKPSSCSTGTTTEESASFLNGVWLHQNILPPEICTHAWNRFELTASSAMPTNSWNILHHTNSNQRIQFTHKHITGLIDTSLTVSLIFHLCEEHRS